MKKLTEKAFTLVELLIVIGIIGVLATTLLLNMNPAEAQKKSRDTKRLKDLSTLQSAIEGMINDGVNFPSNNTVDSRTAAANSCAANANWTQANLCNYLNTVPVDPSNRSNITFVNSAGAIGNSVGLYRLNYDPGARYKIYTRLESTSNAAKVGSDGGNNNTVYEVFNFAGVAVN
ncbi:hypothetical protein COV58_00905 [Candidatus Roizmanbacteria bacterium CG11_big_fil_rev_8_21_14_0_20_36_8]|uniref:Type II secretion system protein GspG C-terminal domain-containing protein n=2 Tax=Candidatus Roizmaniibacteriota TaxID=1752723 RepID=A0A2M6IVA5_9BACT|nr:MAG: hypothetical protein COV58_00905 [Candidatus Roizmanbacteria bacterium CG11_big_fil_rev_8_21_14_0_20_36_8]PIZ66377.1 MAG: hypothetical protein COY14_00460 [Candidatus Roizmanbacteria bacterium CG_4_10_14_0_2_um_filter_36_9]